MDGFRIYILQFPGSQSLLAIKITPNKKSRPVTDGFLNYIMVLTKASTPCRNPVHHLVPGITKYSPARSEPGTGCR